MHPSFASQKPPDDVEVLCLKEAAYILRISVRTLYDLLQDKKKAPPHKRVGDQYRFTRVALINWLNPGDK